LKKIIAVFTLVGSTFIIMILLEAYRPELLQFIPTILLLFSMLFIFSERIGINIHPDILKMRTVIFAVAGLLMLLMLRDVWIRSGLILIVFSFISWMAFLKESSSEGGR